MKIPKHCFNTLQYLIDQCEYWGWKHADTLNTLVLVTYEQKDDLKDLKEILDKYKDN